MDDYKELNEILVRLFRNIMDIEEKAIITQEFQDITNNDMHVIEAIGMGTPKNMSSIAKELSVTVGTLTIYEQSGKKRLCEERTRGRRPACRIYIAFGQRKEGVYSSCEIS